MSAVVTWSGISSVKVTVRHRKLENGDTVSSVSIEFLNHNGRWDGTALASGYARPGEPLLKFEVAEIHEENK